MKSHDRGLFAGFFQGKGSDLGGRVLLSAVAFVCLIMMAVVWWFYRAARLENQDFARRSVLAVTMIRSDQLRNWRHERIGDGRSLRVAHVDDTSMRILQGLPVGAEDLKEFKLRLQVLIDEFGYSDIALVRADGSVAERLGPGPLQDDIFSPASRVAAIKQAAAADDVVMTDLTQDTRDGSPRMSVVVPLGRVGAFLLEIDPAHFLLPYLEQSWQGYSRTGESLLVRLEGKQMVYLSRSRLASVAMPFYRRDIPIDLPSPAVLDAGWVLNGADYRGKQVIAAIRKVPDSPWYLISKIDVDEVESTTRQMGWQTIALMAFICIAGAAGIGTLWMKHRKDIHLEKEEWFLAIANDSPAYLWMMSADGAITFLNAPLMRFLGVEQLDPAWQFADSIHPDDTERAQQALRESVELRRGNVAEYRLRRFDGEYRSVISESVARLDDDHQFIGFAGSVSDVTEQRNAEARWAQANSVLAREVEEHARTAEEVRSLSARLMGAREEERKRLSSELHDDLNQQIAAVSIAVGNMKRHIPEDQWKLRTQSDLIHQSLVGISETVHRISHELRPAVLEFQGLIPALRVCTENFSALTGIHTTFVVHAQFPEPELPKALGIYRIVQEALQNIAKHSQSKTARIAVGILDGILTLSISDEGIGMSAHAAASPQGLGLIGIRERVRLLQGEIQIDTTQGKGTVLTITFPIGAQPGTFTDSLSQAYLAALS